MPKEKPKVNIGEVIKSYRSERGLSQGDIERRTGLLRCYLSRVENGHTVPAIETLEKMARVQRQQADPQKLASQAGRMLERLKAHKYFTYRVNPQGVLEWEEKQATIQKEVQRDGWYLLHTNCPAEICDKEKVLAHYKGLLNVEAAFCQLKSYLEVRPIFHRRPDRVRNHVRLCFIAYWLSARLGNEWRNSGENGEVPRILRRLQSIRIGQLQVAGRTARSLMTEIPKELNQLLEKLKVNKLFATVPDWAL